MNFNSLNFEDLQAIRFIPFSRFKQHGTFPRYPDNQELTISLKDIDSDTYSQSLFVFISHCWLRGWPGAKGWNGKPHPDNVDDGKYALCTQGIDQILQSLAPEMKECFLWLDFGCIDQDGNPAGELKMLDKIVQVCDCLFTPIFDEDPDSWEIPSKFSSWYEAYKSPAWKDGPYAYLNRGWCRIEMFYGSNIPLIEDSTERRNRMKAGLLYHRSEGRRPHILYGTKQQVLSHPFVILEPLQNCLFEKYHPSRGEVTVESDKETIDHLVKEIEPYMNHANMGYEGHRDSLGRRQGWGKYTFADGGVYEGEWKSNRREGRGKYTFIGGEVYDGEWKDDKKEGKGSFHFANGNRYEGEFKNDQIRGMGKFTLVNGDVYEGECKDGKRHGRGKILYANGDMYEGEWRDDQMHGRGFYLYANGDSYDGEWKQDNKSGKGLYFFSNQEVYDGEWKDGKMHGYGKYTYQNGDIYEGKWKNHMIHGQGKYYYVYGDVYDGEWKANNKHGRGRLLSSDGTVYEGEWRDGLKHGRGKRRSLDGRLTILKYERDQLVSDNLARETVAENWACNCILS